MDLLDLNKILDREEIKNKIGNILINFSKNKKNLLEKRGIYIYGAAGCGKTSFVKKLLKEFDYDIIHYDAGDIRNKSIIDTITKDNMSDKNILSLFTKKIQPIAIVMDEIDGMNNGDKGGINSLIKLMRPKKTKKQKKEDITYNPIICIGNYYMDKKIKELMKVCTHIELKPPTEEQMFTIISEIMPSLDNTFKNNIVHFLNGDLRKLKEIYDIYLNKPEIINNNIIKNIFKKKEYNENTKEITKTLLCKPRMIKDHLTTMNETDRTIVGLLWHENIIDHLEKTDKNISVPFYNSVLNNICFADYIDRIIFQNQIWQLNEMSSLIKIFYSNNMFHEWKKNNNIENVNTNNIRFTKVLTKYSTEYNNSTFIQNLCQELSMDKKDMLSFFLNLKKKYSEEELCKLLEQYEIGKLDIARIYRYIDKYTLLS